jgi:hypothetical protein
MGRILAELKLADELNINMDEITKDKYNTTDIIKVTFVYKSKKIETKYNLINKKIHLYELSKQSDESIADVLRRDLENLTYIMKKNQGLYDDGDDSLLMTLTSKSDHEKYMKELKRKKKAIDERQKKFMEEIKIPSSKEMEHPQPATFENKFYNDVN